MFSIQTVTPICTTQRIWGNLFNPLKEAMVERAPFRKLFKQQVGQLVPHFKGLCPTVHFGKITSELPLYAYVQGVSKPFRT